jgi:hypothetical protein
LLKNDNAILLGDYPKLTSKTKITFKCSCNNIGSKSFSILPDYGIHCRLCVNKIMIEKTKKTNLIKYGCEDPNKLSTMKGKIKNIFQEKYGVDSAAKLDSVKNKIKKTNLIKYGVENPFQNSKIKEKIINTLQSKYGVNHPLQNKVIYNKFKNTLLKHYNVEIPYHSDKLKQKGKETCLKRFGVVYSLQNKDIINKRKKTNLIKYGFENVMQSIIIQEKYQKNAFKHKKFIMPSGNIRIVQGYEPYALRDLIKKYNEDEIITLRKDIPCISYTVNLKNKYYFPDIYIPHENKIIEVKSTWTYKKDLEINKLKSEATINSGFNYEIWIYNYKGEKIINL